jgi:hypothetical protein
MRFDEDLDAAAKAALRDMIELIRERGNVVGGSLPKWHRLASESSRASCFRTFDPGGTVSRQFAAAVYPTIWNASAARNTVPSSQWRPTSIMPTGSPADMPAGTVAAGWPVTSNGQVLEIISSARAT